jgi:hypothetical protein
MIKYLRLVPPALLCLSAILQCARAGEVVNPPDPFTVTVNGVASTPGTLTFNPSTNLWGSDPIGGPSYDTSLPPGTFFDGGNPLSIDLDLSAPITLGNNINFGFGLAGLNFFQPGEPMFDFSISLDEDGTPITAPFGLDVTNTFSFAINNIGTGTSTTITGGSFDQIDITVTAPQQIFADPPASSFSVNVGNEVATVPDDGATLVLLALGLSCLAAAARRALAVPS